MHKLPPKGGFLREKSEKNYVSIMRNILKEVL